MNVGLIRSWPFVATVLFAAAAGLGLIARSAGPATAAGAKTTIVTKTFKLKKANKAVRFEVHCHGNKNPLGGGEIARPSVSSNGEGAYPTSSERLGAKDGWHIGAVLLDRTPKKTTPRKVKLQVVCGPRLGRVKAVHRIVRVRSGQTRKAVAKCPGGRRIAGGGFLSSLMTNKKGEYVTSSRRLSGKSWVVHAHAFGGAKSALITSVAYCVKSKRLPLRQVSRSVTLPNGIGSVATPRCPGNRRLVTGGFNGPSSGSVRFFDTHFTGKGTWSVSGISSKASQHITAYGYCL